MQPQEVQMSKPFPLRTKFSWTFNTEEQDDQPVSQTDPYFIVMEGKIVIPRKLSSNFKI